MTKESNNYEPSKTKKLLLILVDSLGQSFEKGMDMYKIRPYGGVPIREIRRDREQREERRRSYLEYQRLKALEHQRLVKLRREGTELYFQLTKAGFEIALKTRILFNKQLLPEGEVTLVTFDVPEDIKHVRNALRSLLKRADFYIVQRSVWESEYDVVDDLRKLVMLMKADKYIRVYRALPPR